jgi:hypothetical protein
MYAQKRFLFTSCRAAVWSSDTSKCKMPSTASTSLCSESGEQKEALVEHTTIEKCNAFLGDVRSCQET